MVERWAQFYGKDILEIRVFLVVCEELVGGI